MLPCPDLDEAIAFCGALGFRRTYRQVRPNPHAVVAREDMTVHLCGIDSFDPASSVSSVIVVVPDAHDLYADFVDRLRRHCGRLPSAGVPRVLRPRRKQGTTTGSTVVDVGGNWLRFYGSADVEEDDVDEAGGPGDDGEAGDRPRSRGLARVLEVVARQGDARGDHARALEVLERGVQRHPGGPPVEEVRVLLHRAELLVRTGELDAAVEAVQQASRVDLSGAQAAAVAHDFAHAREVLRAGS
ncbi:tetratricopeptide repeat protein [Kineococcus sp. SYSU DK006]|uniref:tetratricopeptide repeat protein n=1 Tax=Kineococcus sp. SYSU DK006 TaxID=3383127 RepID=UPI003D7E7B17